LFLWIARISCNRSEFIKNKFFRRQNKCDYVRSIITFSVENRSFKIIPRPAIQQYPWIHFKSFQWKRKNWNDHWFRNMLIQFRAQITLPRTKIFMTKNFQSINNLGPNRFNEFIKWNNLNKLSNLFIGKESNFQ
jgi:hypothetical protein